jgi:hypothetical protein
MWDQLCDMGESCRLGLLSKAGEGWERRLVSSARATAAGGLDRGLNGYPRRGAAA